MSATINLQCKKCHKDFSKEKREYNRKIKHGNTNFYCSLECSSAAKKEKAILKKVCAHCNNLFEGNKNKKCCSNMCARKYSSSFVDRTESGKKQLSNTLKRYHQQKPKQQKNNKKEHTCIICKTLFYRGLKRKIYQTCSRECLNQLISFNSSKNQNCGGETNYKKFQYKSIWMDSSWEVEIAKWLDQNKIEWVRSKNINFLWTDVDNRIRRYYPDFYLPKYDIYLDPKNSFKAKQDEYKLKKVISENNINLISGEIDYIIKKVSEIFR